MTPVKEHKSLLEKFIATVPLFRNFSDVHLKHITEEFKTLKINKGKTILFQSDDSTDLYIVLEGQVRISLVDAGGGELVLTTFKKGDFFGEMSLIDGKPRSASVIADEATLLGVLKREKIFNVIKKDPLTAIEFMEALVERLRNANEMISALAFLDVNERLLKLFADIIDNDGRKKQDGFYMIKKFTQKELAARIGASREAVSKILRVLSMKGMIEDRGTHYLISPHIYEEIERFSP